MKRNPLNTLAAVVLLAMAVGCNSSAVPAAPYIAADRLNYTAVKGFLSFTKQDRPQLAPAIDDQLDSWNKRLTEAEKATVVP